MKLQEKWMYLWFTNLYISIILFFNQSPIKIYMKKKKMQQVDALLHCVSNKHGVAY